MLRGKRVGIASYRGVDRVVPGEVQSVVVVPVVGIALPVSRQAESVRRLVETTIANQFRIQSALNILEHELGELPVQNRTDGVLDFARIDCEGCLGLLLRRCDGTRAEKE